MALDSMSDSCLFQLEKYFNTNPYRAYAMNRPYVPISAHSNRLIKPSSLAAHRLINNQKNPLILDRINYKLRMKSDLNVDTLRATQRHGSHRTNSNTKDSLNSIPRSATTKTFARQPTAITRTTNSMKTIFSGDINGIEGNAVHVGTLKDLIKHFHREELRLIHRPMELLYNTSTYTPNNQLMYGRTTPKTPTFQSDRMMKQPQTLTEYQFKAPTLPRTTYRNRRKEKRNNNIDLHLLTNEYSNNQQLRAMTSHDKRIQESRQKTLLHNEKQVCVCNKVTIIDPYNSEQDQLTLPSTRYIFPPIRAFGYYTKKTIDDIPQSTPLIIKKLHETKRISKNSSDTIDHVSTYADESSQLNKSISTLSDLDDDLQNPPNTRINVDIKQ